VQSNILKHCNRHVFSTSLHFQHAHDPWCDKYKTKNCTVQLAIWPLHSAVHNSITYDYTHKHNFQVNQTHFICAHPHHYKLILLHIIPRPPPYPISSASIQRKQSCICPPHTYQLCRTQNNPSWTLLPNLSQLHSFDHHYHSTPDCSTIGPTI
jgi:hypothetical protein